MILAVSNPQKRELIIAAAETLDEQRTFLSWIVQEHPALIQDTDFTRFLIDPELAKFKLKPTILEFPSADELQTFIAENGIDIVPIQVAQSRQQRMLLKEEYDVKDNRPLGEVHDLTENDPWDRRTPEQKEEAEKRKKAMEEKIKAGEITGDSFGGGTASDENASSDATDEEDDDGISIRDVKVKVDDQGNVTDVEVLADKDLFSGELYLVILRDENGDAIKDADPYENLLKWAGLKGWKKFKRQPDGGITISLGGAATVRMTEAVAEIGGPGASITRMERPVEEEGLDPELVIADDTLVSIYYRVLSSKPYGETLTAIESDGGKKPFRGRDYHGGSWLAYVRARDAERAVEALDKAKIACRMAEVDHNGQRIIEEGAEAKVIDIGAAEIEPPLPWNDRAAEFYAMSDEEKQKALQGKWLLYSIRDYGVPHGRIIHITPRSYFREHGVMWEGDLPIDHLLPSNIVKWGEKVGVYQCNSLDMNTTDFLLGNRAGMRESLLLRAHLNTLGSKAQ